MSFCRGRVAWGYNVGSTAVAEALAHDPDGTPVPGVVVTLLSRDGPGPVISLLRESYLCARSLCWLRAES